MWSILKCVSGLAIVKCAKGCYLLTACDISDMLQEWHLHVFINVSFLCYELWLSIKSVQWSLSNLIVHWSAWNQDELEWTPCQIFLLKRWKIGVSIRLVYLQRKISDTASLDSSTCLIILFFNHGGFFTSMPNRDLQPYLWRWVAIFHNTWINSCRVRYWAPAPSEVWRAVRGRGSTMETRGQDHCSVVMRSEFKPQSEVYWIHRCFL